MKGKWRLEAKAELADQSGTDAEAFVASRKVKGRLVVDRQKLLAEAGVAGYIPLPVVDNFYAGRSIKVVNKSSTPFISPPEHAES